MSSYKAPLDDIRFALFDVLDEQGVGESIERRQDGEIQAEIAERRDIGGVFGGEAREVGIGAGSRSRIRATGAAARFVSERR